MSPTAKKQPSATASSAGPSGIDVSLLKAVYSGDAQAVARAVDQGADVNSVHEQTGLSPLHLAVGMNNLVLTRYLIEQAGAKIRPDRSGRWPTVIAAECEVSEAMSDYIVEQEAKITPGAK